MEDVTDQKLLEILRDAGKTRAFFSQETTLRALIDSAEQRERVARVIAGAGLDLVSISATVQAVSGGRVSLVAPRRD